MSWLNLSSLPAGSVDNQCNRVVDVDVIEWLSVSAKVVIILVDTAGFYGQAVCEIGAP